MPPSAAVRALLAGAIDYAGLFPPAALDMRAAVASYAEYRCGPDAWALGRFVVPMARLQEMREARTDDVGEAAEAWPLSVLANLDTSVIGSIRDFNDRENGRFVIDCVETKLTFDPASAQRLGELTGQLRDIEVYAEIPIDHDPDALVGAIKRHGARPKVRTGGVTPSMFPSAADLARFIMRCAEHDVPFKATAGLHHPLRARHPLTYEADSPQAPMFGFLNVLLAAAFVRAGTIASAADAVALLEATDPRELSFDDGGVTWRARRVTLEQLRDARLRASVSFGSCSFQEPLQDLRMLALL